MTEDLIAVGRVVGPHGILGDVVVEVLTEFPDRRFAPGSRLRRSSRDVLTVASARYRNDRLLVRFHEIGDRTAAESLRNEMVYVLESELPELPEGSYWPHQLLGCSVSTQDGEEVGVVSRIVSGPAHDLWVVAAGDRTVMIPAISSIVVGVDVPARRVTVRPLPGLLEG